MNRNSPPTLPAATADSCLWGGRGTRPAHKGPFRAGGREGAGGAARSPTAACAAERSRFTTALFCSGRRPAAGMEGRSERARGEVAGSEAPSTFWLLSSAVRSERDQAGHVHRRCTPPAPVHHPPRQSGGMCSGSVGSGRSVPSVSAPRPAAVVVSSEAAMRHAGQQRGHVS